MHHRASRLLMVGVCVSAAACAPSGSDDRAAQATESARTFIAWYFAARDSGGAGGSIEHAVGLRPEAFESTLLAALRADLAASAASPGAIVGLDFDPVTASQDPCERYEPQPAMPNGDGMSVVLAESCAHTQPRQLPVSIELKEVGGRWLVANFVYPDSSHLLGILNRLAADREETPSPPTA